MFEGAKVTVSAYNFLLHLFRILYQKKMIYRFTYDEFRQNLFKLKKSEYTSGIMDDINFYYCNGDYFSDEFDAAITLLQNYSVIAFENPEFLYFRLIKERDFGKNELEENKELEEKLVKLDELALEIFNERM